MSIIIFKKIVQKLVLLISVSKRAGMIFNHVFRSAGCFTLSVRFEY